MVLMNGSAMGGVFLLGFWVRIFGKQAKSGEGLMPIIFEPSLCLFKALLLQMVEVAIAVGLMVYQPCLGEQLQMFGNGGAADGELFGNVADCMGFIGQKFDDLAAQGVA